MIIENKIIDFLKEEYDYASFMTDVEYRKEIYKNYDVDENKTVEFYNLLNEYDERVMYFEHVNIPEELTYDNNNI
jgi:hypothetical protein